MINIKIYMYSLMKIVKLCVFETYNAAVFVIST